MAVSLHMAIHSPLKQLGLDSMIYIVLPGSFWLQIASLQVQRLSQAQQQGKDQSLVINN